MDGIDDGSYHMLQINIIDHFPVLHVIACVDSNETHLFLEIQFTLYAEYNAFHITRLSDNRIIVPANHEIHSP